MKMIHVAAYDNDLDEVWQTSHIELRLVMEVDNAGKGSAAQRFRGHSGTWAYFGIDERDSMCFDRASSFAQL